MIYKVGFYTGLCWSGSFLLAMFSLSQPMFGLTGNLLGLASIWVAGWMLRKVQAEDHASEPWGVSQRWRMSLKAQMLAAVLCLFVQYMYFRYIDNGHFLSAAIEMYSQPEYAEMLQQMAPGSKPQDILDAFSAIPLNLLALNFLLINSLFAIVLSIPTAFVARMKDKR